MSDVIALATERRDTALLVYAEALQGYRPGGDVDDFNQGYIAAMNAFDEADDALYAAKAGCYNA